MSPDDTARKHGDDDVVVSDEWRDPIDALVAAGLPLDFLLAHAEETYNRVEALQQVMTLEELLSYSRESYAAFHGEQAGQAD